MVVGRRAERQHRKLGERALDHFAFVIGLEDYDERRRQLELLGVPVRPKEFPRFHWRSLFVSDPEGNTVEFVCYDSSV